MIRVCETGRNPTMRYLQRTHRVSVAWLHERFSQDDIELFYEESSKMCGDIYTKGFTDVARWVHACDLINVIDPANLAAFCADSIGAGTTSPGPNNNDKDNNNKGQNNNNNNLAAPSQEGGHQTSHTANPNAKTLARTPRGSGAKSDGQEDVQKGKKTKHKRERKAAKYYDRVLVEACCNKDSLLSRQTPYSKDCLVIGITEEDDFTSKYGKELAKRFLIGKCCALWFSSPCTGGSP